MAKPLVRETRFDFRKGRNTAISPDLLNDDELVDTTNARLSEKYGAFTKRSGCQRLHPNAFPAAIRGITQWDALSGKQIVVISNGDLYFRDGSDYSAAFTKATSSAVARSTANQDSPPTQTAGWLDADGTDDGKNSNGGSGTSPGSGSATVAAGSRLINKVGDPTIGTNVDAVDDLYTLGFKITVQNSGFGSVGFATAAVTLEYSTDGGGAWSPVTGAYFSVTVGNGTQTQTFTPVVQVAGAPAQVWFRLVLTTSWSYIDDPGFPGTGTFDVTGTVQCFNVTYKTDNFPTTWTTGAAKFSLTQPAIFAPFRASSSGAPLVLYIASGGHYFSWDGSATLTQLDPINSAPLATAIISYHTRMFAMSASTETPGLLPKTIFWSKIGDATNFNTGDKTLGGAAVTDFLTGQQLTALEVIGSSLLMATLDSIMRFQGHASDDIVISQDTEGISAEVGCIGPLALKRFENVAAFLTNRGPYAATEVSAVPIGEQVLPDFDALDSANLSKSVVQYNRGRKELLFVVPGAADSGLNKTIFVQAVRLQAWYGPWIYPFGINCMSNYIGASGIENVIAGCSDGYVRLMDVGSKDDVLYNGTGGSNITMTVELPTMQFGLPGVTKALNTMHLQATLPSGSDLRIQHGFDGESLIEDAVASSGESELNYRVDLDNQGKRLRMLFIDASSKQPIINGFIMDAYDYQRP